METHGGDRILFAQNGLVKVHVEEGAEEKRLLTRSTIRRTSGSETSTGQQSGVARSLIDVCV